MVLPWWTDELHHNYSLAPLPQRGGREGGERAGGEKVWWERKRLTGWEKDNLMRGKRNNNNNKNHTKIILLYWLIQQKCDQTHLHEFPSKQSNLYHIRKMLKMLQMWKKNPTKFQLLTGPRSWIHDSKR